MFYIIYQGISPNTASGNRFISFLRGFDELGVRCIAILLNPSISHFRITEQFHHIEVKYYWRDWRFARRVLDRLYRPVALQRFKLLLKKGDIVFCFGTAELVEQLVAIEGVAVYHERTESPEVLPLASKRRQKGYLEACKSLAGLFVISTALKSYFVSEGVPEKNVHIINMTVDVHRFENLQRTPLGEKYIGYCGTASNNKDGVDELIKAFVKVVQMHNDVKLYIIGKTPSSDDKAGNLKLIRDLDLTNRVVFTGMVEAARMPQLLMDASVLALDRPDSLQARNGFPTKLGEYLMTGNPVVVTRIGDIPLFLKDGESALLAEQKNQEDFAAKLCWVLEHPKEAAVIGKKGKDVAMREFNYLIESKKIIDIIMAK